MDFLEPLDLTVAKRPVLLQGETVGVTVGDVGLYNGAERLKDLDAGSVYITSHRILWVDEAKGHGVQLSLAVVQEIDSSPGFLRTSPKITLKLAATATASPLSASAASAADLSAGRQDHTANADHPSSSSMLLPDWTCEICENVNPGSLAKCSLCGVPNTRPAEAVAASSASASYSMASVSSLATPRPADNTAAAMIPLSRPSEQQYADWTCEICENINSGSQTKCELCGVGATQPRVPLKMAGTPSSMSSMPAMYPDANASMILNKHGDSSSNSGSSNAATLAASADKGQIQCPACTFLNHSELRECEVCGTMLPSSSPAAASTASPTASPFGASSLPQDKRPLSLASVGASLPQLSVSGNSNSSSSAKGGVVAVLKLSFRGGNMNDALKQLRLAVGAKAWVIKEEPKPLAKTSSVASVQATGGVGIASIMRTVEQNKKQMESTVGDAFSDLASLMEKASEMVKLAESISAKLASTSEQGGSDSPEMATFRKYLTELGISNPVTKETAGDLYTQELARQMADFLDQVFKPGHTDMMALTDLYCLFNRARGVALVSPEDLYRSTLEFERLRLPFRIHTFESGLRVVQSVHHSDDAVASRILSLFEQDAPTGLTAIDLAKRQGISIMLANEQLLMTERAGLTCRDDTQEGLFFYPNLFAQ
ncbi:EAP30/Vps36 family-domain-containing protein [Entophlyctis helioformis]|nr:EAP30/Vps36 family-domain-containing protein [Entophlyctis helioformis]